MFISTLYYYSFQFVIITDINTIIIVCSFCYQFCCYYLFWKRTGQFGLRIFILICPKSLLGETGLINVYLDTIWKMSNADRSSTWLKSNNTKKGYFRIREEIIQLWKFYFTALMGTNQKKKSSLNWTEISFVKTN